MIIAQGKRGTSAALGNAATQILSSLSSLGGEGRGEEVVRAASKPFTGKINQPLQATPEYACVLFVSQGSGAPAPPRCTY